MYFIMLIIWSVTKAYQSFVLKNFKKYPLANVPLKGTFLKKQMTKVL
jgi:hypothetical protein